MRALFGFGIKAATDFRLISTVTIRTRPALAVT
jgi:hypothetical protein